MSALWELLCSVAPDLFVTLVALLLGIPFALWTDRRLKEREARAQDAEIKERLNRALTVLEESLGHNQIELVKLVVVLKRNEARISPALDSSGWEACKAEVIPYLRNPGLQRRLAFYFARVGTLIRTNGMYLEYFIGVASALQGTGAIKDHLRQYLLDESGTLLIEGKALTDALANAKGATDEVGKT